jgi:mono/diheme cytochrome c family protein
MSRIGQRYVAIIAAGAIGIATPHSRASTPASEAASGPEPAADPSPGKKLFRENCSRCHGFDMMNPAPGVADLRALPLDDKSRFVVSVSDGKGAMPAWRAVLTPEDIENLWSYVSAGRSP